MGLGKVLADERPVSVTNLQLEGGDMAKIFYHGRLFVIIYQSNGIHHNI